MQDMTDEQLEIANRNKKDHISPLVLHNSNILIRKG